MPTSDHTCPRCAYDLSGVITSWRDSCPLTGICSECGLSFTWRDVISGPLGLPRWSFEHATPNRLISTCFATLLRALQPQRMWSELRLEMRIETRRLVWFAVLGFLLWKALGLAVLGTITGAAAYFGTGWWSPLEDASAFEITIFVLWPYSELEVWPTPDQLVSPWVVIAALTVLLTPPAFFLVPESLRRARVRRQHIFRIACYSIATMPLMIGMWSLLKCADTIYLEMDLDPPWLLQLPFRGDGSLGVGSVSLVWTIVMLLVFWGAAVRSYLRLPHPGGVTIAIVTVAVLLAAVFVALIDGPSLFR